jgi:DNA-binding MarR family transcriptional regulator
MSCERPGLAGLHPWRTATLVGDLPPNATSDASWRRTAPGVEIGGLTVAETPTPRVTYAVKRLESAIRGRLDKICRHHGITTAQYTALSVLRSRPGMSSAQLAVRSFIKPQSANQTVAELEGLGCIERSVDDVNLRVLRIRLTDHGHALLAACDEAVDELEALMFQGLRERDVVKLQELLGRCTRNLSG